MTSIGINMSSVYRSRIKNEDGLGHHEQVRHVNELKEMQFPFEPLRREPLIPRFSGESMA
jgi:hypothetical protein